MSYSDNIQLCFTDPSRLHSSEVLDTLTSALIRDGFRLALFGTDLEWGTDPEYHLWFAHLYNNKHPDYQALSAERKMQLEQPGMTPLLEEKMNDFISYKLKQLDIRLLGVSPETRALDFTISILNEIEETDAGVLHSVLSRNGEIEIYWFQRLPDLLYNTLHPDFAYLRTSYDNAFLSRNFQRGDLPYLYTENYFGPALVAKIGRERLLTTPGAEVHDLSDGGLFMRIEGEREAACQHLGLIWQADARLE